MALKRITKEISDLNARPIPGITIDYDENNLLAWTCSIQGPAESPYKGGTFILKVGFDTSFPFKAPDVKFQTKIYHPGINEEGEICIALLKSEWKPSIMMSKVLTTVLEKLGNPSPDDPFNPDIAAELRDNKSQFETKAKEWTKKYAK